MPGSDQLYRKYLHEVNEKDIGTISRVLKERPISITVDETPEIRGRPAVAVLATFYDDDLPGCKTLIIDLQVLQQCNAVSVGMLIQASLQKVGKTLADVAVLSSYMQTLHKDLQLSSPEFKAFHFKDPCHLLNNVLDDGLKTDSFVVVHDFVVHFPALLKPSRELRRKFGLVCTSMGMKIKCLSTVSPSRWFSFHEALEDILDYWRAILSFLRSDDAKGKKCEKLQALVSSPDDVHDLLIKLKFLKTNSSAVLSIIKELEAESTLVYEVYPILGVRFCALLSQWRDPSETSLTSDVASLLDLLDECNRSRTIADLHEYYAAVTRKWSQTVERNLADELKYTSESFWYNVQIVNPNVKLELPRPFENYEHIFRLVFLETDDMRQLIDDFGNYQSYAIPNIVDPLSFWKLHAVQWPVLSRCALRLLALPVSSANVERAFSMLRVISRKERAAMSDANLVKYACIYYNKL
ncbi:hypothetical protein HPB47_026562 [Ixodes persulcatus]|uniref:Uncharacterized protein n=1 Tax=Ixodes persulcatus TaxID=34615 RepID=A0AC60PYD3_IXOPE|nr:hypothetical protein HPB47_026562 [Ixodes persulcatus]